LKVAWGKLARSACAASLFGTVAFARAGDPAVRQLRLVAIDSTACVAVVKLDDSKPQAWHIGESLNIGTQHAKLRECAGNRAIIEIVRRGAVSLTVLISTGESYRIEAAGAPSPLLRASVAPAHER
jgi:hypothetical protein